MAHAEYTTDTATGELHMLPLASILPSEDNPRETLADLDALAASIRELGLLSPVLVEATGEDTYRLVAGARRLAASQMAGLTEIHALVRSLDPVARKLAQVTENTGRVALSALEEAAAYQELLALDVNSDTVARAVGRPRTEVDGRLAVFALPANVRAMLAEDALTYAEALLLTEIAEYPEDIGEALALSERWGWTVGQAVDRVRRERAAAIKSAETRATLERQKVTIIDPPEYGNLTGKDTARRLGKGFGEVAITRTQHKKEPCHAAYIGHDGAAVYVCRDPRRHNPDRTDGEAAHTRDVKAERAAKRAANKARRQASTARTDHAVALLTGEAPLDVLGYLVGAVVDHAPREILPAAARLLGLEIPAGQGWAASDPADAALRVHAANDGDHALRVAVAIHWALAEKDAGAEHASWRGGPGVLAYTDVLVANGYTETVGDAVNRERYAPKHWETPMPEDDGDDIGDSEADAAPGQ